MKKTGYSGANGRALLLSNIIVSALDKMLDTTKESLDFWHESKKASKFYHMGFRDALQGIRGVTQKGVSEIFSDKEIASIIEQLREGDEVTQ